MFEIKDRDAKQFLEGLRAWVAKTELEVAEVYRGYATVIFNFLLYETPQWTGSAVSNWNFGVGAADNTFDPSLKQSNLSERAAVSSGRTRRRISYGTPIFQKGSEAPINVAVSRNRAKPASLTFKNDGLTLPPVFITNNAQDLNDGKVYASYLENNPNNYLRAVNEPGHMVARVTQLTAMAFPFISKEKSLLLRRAKIGSKTNAGLR